MHAQGRVEAVLDRVVRPPGHVLGDDGPLLAELLVQLHEIFVLFERPLFSNDLWVQMIVVTLSTLLPGAAGQL